MSEWVSVRPGRKPRRASHPAPASPAASSPIPSEEPTATAPAVAGERCCGDGSHVPALPVLPKPQLLQCSGCHGRGRVRRTWWTSTFTVGTAPVVGGGQLISPAPAQEVTCAACSGLGWVLPAPMGLPAPSPVPVQPHPWWAPAQPGPIITC